MIYQDISVVSLDHPHGHSAVDHDIFAGDEIILDQLDNQGGYVFGSAFAVQRNPLVDAIPDLLLGQEILEGRSNHSR